MKIFMSALVFGCAGLCAQTPDTAKLAAEQKQIVSGPIGIQTAMAGPVAKVAGAPYSADAVTERVQTLADGNRIVQTSTSTVARDSQGRVRRDESLAIALPGKSDAPKLEMIDDPVTGTHWTLDPQKKTAMKMAVSIPPPGSEKSFFFATAGPALAMPASPGGPVVEVHTETKLKAEADAVRTDLGTQSMEGVAAQGTRTTRTLAAGSVGNDQPIIITTETWYSPDLKVLVMSKVDDPRMGVTTYRLTNIQRAEPAASLFEIPSDYTVQDKPGNVFFYKQKQD